MIEYGLSQAYESSAGMEGCARPDGVQFNDNGFKPIDQHWIAIAEFIKLPGLLLEHTEDRIQRLALINGGSSWVVEEVLACVLGVLSQGRVKVGIGGGGCGGCI